MPVKNTFLVLLLAAGCAEPTPKQAAADNFFAKAQNTLIIKCKGKYDMDALRDTFRHLRSSDPDSALNWSARLFINAKVGVCPE